MKAIVNAPFRYPELNVGSIAYGLAHEAQKHQHYKSYLTTQAVSGKHVILDNAADELGEGMTGQGLFDLACEIRPRELILPDVLQDTEATLRNTFDFYKQFFEFSMKTEIQFMVVPQGKTFEDWMHCFGQFKHWNKHSVWGIPYDIEFDVPVDLDCPSADPRFWRSRVFDTDSKTIKRAKRRLNLVRYLYDYGHVDREIHLLGTNNLSELRAYKRLNEPTIRSNDTTAPFAAASADRLWLCGDSGEKDWLALDFDVEWDLDARKRANYNLFEYILACDDVQAMYNFAVINEGKYNGITPRWEAVRV